MKKSTLILLIASVSLFLASCGQRQQKSIHSEATTPIDSLNAKIQSLEEKNAEQDARIKDLEDDLEDVIRFLNEQGY